MDGTSIPRLVLLHLDVPTRDLIVVLLALPEYLDVFACSLGQESRFLIFRRFVVIDYHLHHLFLRAV